MHLKTPQRPIMSHRKTNNLTGEADLIAIMLWFHAMRKNPIFLSTKTTVSDLKLRESTSLFRYYEKVPRYYEMASRLFEKVPIAQNRKSIPKILSGKNFPKM